MKLNTAYVNLLLVLGSAAAETSLRGNSDERDLTFDDLWKVWDKRRVHKPPPPKPWPKKEPGCIDFEEFSMGDLITNQIDGVMVSTWPAGKAMIFDSTDFTGGDLDLRQDAGWPQPQKLGNMLICSEDGNQDDPDDDADGCEITFKWDKPVNLRKVGLKDNEEGAVFKLFNEAGRRIARIEDPKGGEDANFKEVHLDTNHVKSMRVVLKGSGALPYVCVDEEGEIDLEQKVRIEKPSKMGAICDKKSDKKLGKPTRLSFRFFPATGSDDSQDDGKVEVTEFGRGVDPAQDCGGRRVIVSGESKASKALSSSKNFFDGTVECDEVFDANGKFGGSTYIHVYAGNNSPLQTAEFHTSCSQPIALGDRYGSSTVVSWEDDMGNIGEMPMLGPNKNDPDADHPMGPEGWQGDVAVFTYVVSNPGHTPICHIDLSATDTVSNVNYDPIPQLMENGLNIGDTDKHGVDGCVDAGEEWLYYYALPLTNAPIGQQKGSSWVKGKEYKAGNLVQADDHAFFKVKKKTFDGDICKKKECGKPVKMTFLYEPGTSVNTDQGDKARSYGKPPRGRAYVVIAKDEKVKSKDAKSSKSSSKSGSSKASKIFFKGYVEPMDMVMATSPGKFPSNIYMLVYANEKDFKHGKRPLQKNSYHASCSKPIRFGDVIGSFQLKSVVLEKCGPLSA